jgi:hypothetical protein
MCRRLCSYVLAPASIVIIFFFGIILMTIGNADYNAELTENWIKTQEFPVNMSVTHKDCYGYTNCTNHTKPDSHYNCLNIFSNYTDIVTPGRYCYIPPQCTHYNKSHCQECHYICFNFYKPCLLDWLHEYCEPFHPQLPRECREEYFSKIPKGCPPPGHQWQCGPYECKCQYNCTHTTQKEYCDVFVGTCANVTVNYAYAIAAFNINRFTRSLSFKCNVNADACIDKTYEASKNYSRTIYYRISDPWKYSLTFDPDLDAASSIMTFGWVIFMLGFAGLIYHMQHYHRYRRCMTVRDVYRRL